MFTCVLGREVASTVLSVSEAADRVGGKLRGDKECPFSDVTKSGRVWRKVPESGARSVAGVLFFFPKNIRFSTHTNPNARKPRST